MADPPKVSVLMTVYNAGRYLEPAVRSIMQQSFTNWEMIIVDDASTDESVQTVQRLQQEDPRIRLILNTANKGQTPCLNQGLSEARARWIARQDADDLSHPLRLTKQYELVTTQDKLVLVGSAGRIIDGDDRLCGLADVPLMPAAISRASAFVNPVLHTAAFFCRSTAASLGNYDESFRIAQDYDLWCRMLSKGRAMNLPQRLVAYRHLETSISKQGSTQAFDEAARVANSVWRDSQDLDHSPPEALKEFREGRSPGPAGQFHKILKALGQQMSDTESGEWRRFTTACLLRAAGASEPGGRRFSYLLRAMQNSPGYFLHWMAERLSG